jgi:hypothetical protein
MRHPGMLIIGIAVTALVLGAAAPAAQAANPDVNRVIDSDSFTDPDFCGTGQAVDVTFSFQGVEFLAPNAGLDYVKITHGAYTLTNPETGATVTNHIVDRYTEAIVSGDPAGVHTVDVQFIGLNEQLRLEHGGLLSRDAGVLVALFTFNGDEFVDAQIVSITGAQPDAASDYSLFCEITTTALGL